MSRGVNQVFLIGNVGKAPDMRTLNNGDPVANFSLATAEKWKDKDSGEYKEKTEWHQCVAFGALAKIIGEYVTKGSKLHVQGKLQTRKWQDKQGQERYTTEIVCNEMLMLDSRNSAGSAAQAPPPVSAYAAQAAPASPSFAPASGPAGPAPELDGADEIPF